MHFILAIDQGTSSTRAIIYTTSGKMIATSQYPVLSKYPYPGWVEQNPEEIWEKTLRAIKEVIAKVEVKKLIACGVTNQRETTVIWNKETGECLYPAIVWQDRRTHVFCETLLADTAVFQNKTGLLPDPYFSASKLQWLLNNVEPARELAKQGKLAFGTIDTFLIWRLTGGKSHVTDITNASRTLLFNINDCHWDEELLQIFKIPASILPKVHRCDANFGTIEKTLFGKSIPITGVAGDQQAALVGQRGFQIGSIKATFGTGGFLLLNTGNKPSHSRYRLLTTIAYQIKEELAYGIEGSLYHAGTTVKWLRDELKIINLASDTESLARSLSSNEGVYLVPSFTGLGAPYWTNTPGALICGLSRNSNRAHFARAALESVCYLTREVLACMKDDTELDFSILRVDGGMAANDWFLQFLASQSNLQIQRPHDIETTAQGAAILAALGCGEISSIQKLQEEWTFEKAFFPEEDKNRIERDYQGWKTALSKVL
ncbi:glycerol kinase (plasmid) [Legionella adelaidensis]|uniref:ATP:glycerol 3-phosphotransferase n=1 Tax=Legionella adelaidensis TaxID=45056 RepID=A0A0W0R4W7_9GAMM|nr:glycerol kinase GlpK [Legionella adelaidensis]KTC66129.1 glycerol kinase [Legionella adelaidensis]VEH85641.1 glycerol kinase [Legionella adelaidensis]